MRAIIFTLTATIFIFNTEVSQAIEETSSTIAPCKNIQGQWKRNDGLEMEFTQSGCTVTGRVLTDSSPNSHQIRAALSGKNGVGYTIRNVNGCSTVLSGEYSVISPNALRIKATGNGCGLVNLNEDFTYYRN